MKPLFAAIVLALAAPAALAAAVGEVTFAAGDARIDGLASRLAKGAQVEVGQTIVTGAGGHVHIRFVDDAFVAIRPNSQLSVDDYRYDAADAASNRVKFTLRNGTSRLITGKAGQANKQGFRLNTPVAAIGVRGTDFVVRASAETTRVTVQQGAVVMAPFADGCSIAGSGPCSGALARQLTSSLSGSYLEQRGQTAPTLIKVEPAKLPDLFALARSEEPAAKAAAAAPAEAPLSASGGAAPLAAGAAAALPAAAAGRTVPDGFTGSPNIFWGRWDAGNNAVVLSSASYEVIAENNGFVLVRPVVGAQTFPDSGQVSFRLVESSLFIRNGNGFGAAEAQSARLSVNFGQQTYDTAIAARAPGGLRDTLFSRGSLSADGRFMPDPARSNAELNGALGNNGSEAGYVYVKSDAAGGFSVIGVTRWER
jgi:hypothetical protein